MNDLSFSVANSRQSALETVAVAVSGGADSLFSLIRLQEQGASVFALHGIFLKPEKDQAADAAASMRDRLDEACRSLGISLHTADLTAAFSREVIRPFVESYARGLTPNPCVFCNARIKFGLLLEAALSLGARRLATGHYATLLPSSLPERVPIAGAAFPALVQGSDELKDQSYFLALVPGEALGKAVFPLGYSRKSEVLAALERRGLTPPQPGESQEVCFVPGDEYRDFVSRMAGEFGVKLPGPGPMLLRDGTRVGTHKGLWQYTEGQRRGLGVGWKEPLHVLAKEGQGNVLRLGGRAEMRTESCVCGEVNVLLPPEFWPDTVWVKARYRERPKAACAGLTTDARGAVRLHIHFLEPESSIAPGQIAAVYVPCSAEELPGAEAGRLRLAAGGVILEAGAEDA